MAKGRKTGGRKKGTPNKGSAEFKQYFDEKGFSCPEEWFNIYEALREAPEQLLYMDIRLKILERITERIHGKVKDVVSFPDIPPKELENAPKEKLFEVVLPDAKNSNQ